MLMKDTKTKTNERELRAVVVPQQYVEFIKENIPENKLTEMEKIWLLHLLLLKWSRLWRMIVT